MKGKTGLNFWQHGSKVTTYGQVLGRFLFLMLTAVFFSGCGESANNGVSDSGVGSGLSTDTVYDTGNSEPDSVDDSDNGGSDTGTAPAEDEDSGGAEEVDTDVPCDDGQTFPGLAGVVWIDICEGGFVMGSDTGDLDEQPPHTVAIKDYRLLETEVTVAQYAACVAANACEEPDTDVKCNWNDSGYENHPVNCVDWHQAVAFCEWAGGRLPSEAEWEFAARRRGRDVLYPWGDDAPSCLLAVMDDGGEGCGTGRTMPVGSKPSGNTRLGFEDLAGNVWEWVQDWYHSDYEGVFKGPPTDGSPWEDPISASRVRRGGSFLATDVYLRATDRGSSNPFYRGANIGFRCARDGRLPLK